MADTSEVKNRCGEPNEQAVCGDVWREIRIDREVIFSVDTNVDNSYLDGPRLFYDTLPGMHIIIFRSRRSSTPPGREMRFSVPGRD